MGCGPSQEQTEQTIVTKNPNSEPKGKKVAKENVKDTKPTTEPNNSKRNEKSPKEKQKPADLIIKEAAEAPKRTSN